MSLKYRVFRVSKESCPTHVVCNGTMGTLYIGRKAAQDYIELKIGRKLDPNTRKSDSTGQWIFKEPRLEKKPSKTKRFLKRHPATANAAVAKFLADKTDSTY